MSTRFVSGTAAERRPSSSHAAPSSAFDEASYPVAVTAEEREIGVQTKRYFDRRLKRRTP
jgi:hypothetical protein